MNTPSRWSSKLAALYPQKQQPPPPPSPPRSTPPTTTRPSPSIPASSKQLPRTPSAPPSNETHHNSALTSAIAPFLYTETTPSLAPSQTPSSPIVTPSNTFLQHRHSFDHVPDSVGDQAWDSIQSLVLPLFTGQGLNSTVEEINILLSSVHSLSPLLLFALLYGTKCLSVLSRYISQQLYGTILEELKDLLRDGVNRLMANFLTPDIAFPDTLSRNPVPASLSLYLFRWTDIWIFYFSVVLPYLQSVFLPLQVEINNSRLVYSVRILVLLAFRDRAVVPHIDSITALIQSLSNEFSSTRLGLSTGSTPTLPPSLERMPSIFYRNAPIPALSAPAIPPTVENRIATLHQMLLVLGDLPVGGASISGGNVGTSQNNTSDDAYMKQIRSLQNPLRTILTCIRTHQNPTTNTTSPA